MNRQKQKLAKSKFIDGNKINSFLDITFFLLTISFSYMCVT